jgi:AraC-like DNA-binding protein
MTPSRANIEFFSRLAEPFTGEALFDCLADVVFFIKNQHGEYVVVNQTLVTRCGRRAKNELLGLRVDRVFPAPLGTGYRAQDERVLQGGGAIRNQLELHFYATGGRGWCITNKLPLYNAAGAVAGLVGISRDLQAVNEGSEDYSSIARVVGRMQAHFDEPLRVRELAAAAGLSAFQFEQRIRKIFQLTAGQLIQKIRMDHAVQRLMQSGETIAEIALRCGYSDQSAFTRQFHKASGLSPQEYRRTFSPPAGPATSKIQTSKSSATSRLKNPI